MKHTLFQSLWIPVLVLAGLSLPFWFTDLDIWAQQLFYDAQKGWLMAEQPFWEFIYKYGIFLGYLLALGALIVISMSYWRAGLIVWRKPAVFLLFVLAIGPGILINLTFKDQWGRPRPRDIVAFGGTEAYIPPGQLGASNGKSFPCGHCSMGFFLAVPFLFLRKKYRIWAYTFLIFGIIYGSLVGVARMMAGGHFLSDVIWSAGIVWIVAVACFHLLRVDREVEIKVLDQGLQKRKARRATLVMGILLPVLTISLLLATPYISKKEFYKTTEEIQGIGSQVIHTRIEEGNLRIRTGEKLQINYQVNAFGFPNSKLRSRWEEGDTATYSIEKLGWFTEVRNNFEITYPFDQGLNYYISVEEGKVFLEIPQNVPATQVNILVKKGDVTLKGKDFHLNYAGVIPGISAADQKRLAESKSPFQVQVKLEKGSLYLQER